MIRAPIGVLLFGIMQFILKSSASESSTSLFHYIKMKYTEIYYYFTVNINQEIDSIYIT